VIIPFEYHRGQWERAWQAWRDQDFDPRAYEIILMIPGDFRERDRLADLEGPSVRVVYSKATHDLSLCADGATRARGEFLFFTESHCWPAPNVLTLCHQALTANPDWAGLSCRSVAITHNALSEAEAQMYAADIDHGLTVHPWRKVLDQCFVTRRTAYEACGGLQADYGHFSEWLLAASYHERGETIGYLPEALFEHYYVGDRVELRDFTLDFTAGEMRYFGDVSGRNQQLLEVPPEWMGQGNHDRGAAAVLMQLAARSLMTPATWREARGSLAQLRRWLVPALCGDSLAILAARLGVLRRQIALQLFGAGAEHHAGGRFKPYVAALIHWQRLSCIRDFRRSVAPPPPLSLSSTPQAVPLGATGFHLTETYQGTTFRWSEAAAAVRFSAPAGRHRLRLACLPVREMTPALGLMIAVDGRPLPDTAVTLAADRVEIDVTLTAAGSHLLGWICRPFAAIDDPRSLGLPIVGIALTPAGDQAR
jgi:hypothetical protein